MNKTVALATPNRAPPPWLASLAASTGEVNGTPTLPEKITITPSQVSEIERRANYLQSVLTTGRDEIAPKAKAITMLFAVLASEAVPPEYHEVRQAAYLEAVNGFPAWAVHQAAVWWRDGLHRSEGENRNFVPKPAELTRLCRKAVEGTERERDATEHLLIAARNRLDNPIGAPTPEERARVAEKLAALKAELSGKREALSRETARHSLASYAMEIGVDFEAAMKSIPDQPVSMQHASLTTPERG